MPESGDPEPEDTAVDGVPPAATAAPTSSDGAPAPRPIDPGVDIGHVHLAIRYPNRASLADALRRLVEARVSLDGASNHGVSEALYLTDPDGNGIELYWDCPREEWPPPTEKGDRVGMYTLPLNVEALLAESEEG